MSNFSRGGSGGGGSSAGMTVVEKEISTSDATPTSFGSLFTPLQASANLCNIRIVSVRSQPANSNWATFQWMGAVAEDVDDDTVFNVFNGAVSASPDNSLNTGVTLRISIAPNTGNTELEVKITANAAEDWIHRLVLEYSPLVFS